MGDGWVDASGCRAWLLFGVGNEGRHVVLGVGVDLNAIVW